MNKESHLLDRIAELEAEVERLREKLRWRNQVHEKHVNELVKQLYDKQGSNKRDSWIPV